MTKGTSLFVLTITIESIVELELVGGKIVPIEIRTLVDLMQLQHQNCLYLAKSLQTW
jgi:hypothetical protein